MVNRRIDEYAGLRRELEIGLRIAPTLASAIPAAKSVASYLDADTQVAVRLVGMTRDGSRLIMTLGICLGTIGEIKAAEPASRAAVLLIQNLVDGLAAYDPAFVTLPDPSSPAARIAAHVISLASSPTAAARPALESTVRQLVAVG